MIAGDKPLVMVVDDDPPTTRVMRLILEMEGYDIQVETSRLHALDSLPQARPSVMIMDYRMAGLTTEEFIERARSGGFLGPILLCTALHQELDVEVEDVLLKPFDPDELIRRVESLIAGDKPNT